jgi:hypothetical protein
LIQEWAVGNNDASQDWLQQLDGKPNYINSIEALHERSQFDDAWKELCDGVCGELGVKLRIWKRNMFEFIRAEKRAKSPAEEGAQEKRIKSEEEKEMVLNIKESRLHDLLMEMQKALNFKSPILPIEKTGNENVWSISDSSKLYPLRAFVNREDEIKLALETFHASHALSDKKTLLLCSQMSGQGKTRFGRELTNPLLYERFRSKDVTKQHKRIFDRLCTAEYVRIDVSNMVKIVNPDQLGMKKWIMVSKICSIFEARKFSVKRVCYFCEDHIADLHLLEDFLFSSLNDNVFLHFDDIDSLAVDKCDDAERMDQFYMFWHEVLSYLKEKIFAFCIGKQAWFQHVGKGFSRLQAPTFLSRIVLRALNKSYISELISMSPAEDPVLRQFKISLI